VNIPVVCCRSAAYRHDFAAAHPLKAVSELIFQSMNLRDTMKNRTALTLLAFVLAGPALAGDDIKLPPEVTPSMRAACETDVRRLCIKPGATLESVRDCVLSKFMRLGKRCQIEIASAGLAP
jgi:hypothetical protein